MLIHNLTNKLIFLIIFTFSTLQAATSETTPITDSIKTHASIIEYSDDAEEEGSGAMSLYGAELKLVLEYGANQTIGLRYQNIDIPDGAIITNAYIQFQTAEASHDTTHLTIYAQASDNAPAFKFAHHNITSRARTSASVSWSPSPWNEIGEKSQTQRTPNLSALIQEVVNRDGWHSNNAIAFIIKGSGERIASSKDGGNAPTLHITYTTKNNKKDEIADTPHDSDKTASIIEYSDDAEEEGSGAMSLYGAELKLVLEYGANQTIGLRYQNIDIPDGAIITNAYIQFQTAEASHDTTHLTIYAQASDNAPAFKFAHHNITSRARTSASVSWSPSPWNEIGEKSQTQRTPNLSALIQEVVNRDGWHSNNAIAFIIKGSGERIASSKDGGNAPTLHITYTTKNNKKDEIADTPHDSDKTAPIITANGNKIQKIELNSNYIDMGATAIDNKDGDITSKIKVTSNLNTAKEGDYTITYTVSDAAGNSASTTREIFVSAAEIVTKRVVLPLFQLADDAEEEANGNISLYSDELELMTRYGTAQTIGLRFQKLEVPSDAIITNAYIEFQVHEAKQEPTDITISAHASDDAPEFGFDAFDISSRPRTNASVEWHVPEWNSVGAKQQTENLASLVQEIIDRDSWVNRGSIAFILEGSGLREAESADGNRAAGPSLHIEYQAKRQASDDAIAPLISLKGGDPLYANLNASFKDPGVIVIDNVDGDISALLTTHSTVDTSKEGTYAITYNVTDNTGNKAKQVTRKVIVKKLPLATKLKINEILPSNTHTEVDPDFGQYSDYIELYNPESTSHS